jgi:hypothetical protein
MKEHTRKERVQLKEFLKSQGGSCSTIYAEKRKTFYRVKLWNVYPPGVMKTLNQMKVFEEYAFSIGATEAYWKKGTSCNYPRIHTSFIAKFPL